MGVISSAQYQLPVGLSIYASLLAYAGFGSPDSAYMPLPHVGLGVALHDVLRRDFAADRKLRGAVREGTVVPLGNVPNPMDHGAFNHAQPPVALVLRKVGDREERLIRGARITSDRELGERVTTWSRFTGEREGFEGLFGQVKKEARRGVLWSRFDRSGEGREGN